MTEISRTSNLTGEMDQSTSYMEETLIERLNVATNKVNIGYMARRYQLRGMAHTVTQVPLLDCWARAGCDGRDGYMLFRLTSGGTGRSPPLLWAGLGHA